MVHWVEKGLKIAVHQPELSCASRERNELISSPTTGIIHTTHKTIMKILTGKVALPCPMPGRLCRRTWAGFSSGAPTPGWNVPVLLIGWPPQPGSDAPGRSGRE